MISSLLPYVPFFQVEQKGLNFNYESRSVTEFLNQRDPTRLKFVSFFSLWAVSYTRPCNSFIADKDDSPLDTHSGLEDVSVNAENKA